MLHYPRIGIALAMRKPKTPTRIAIAILVAFVAILVPAFAALTFRQ